MVEIIVVDDNDNAPEFMGKNEYSVPENCRKGSLVGFLSAHDADKNSTLRYDITLTREVRDK